MPLHLIDVSAPFSVAEVEKDVLLVRGFASTDLVDRSGHVVSPTEFDVPTFLATSGQLLLDHNFIKTEDGNSVSAGNVQMAVPAYIVGENQTNPTEWIINSLEDDTFVSTFEKNMIPRMLPGDRGLFIVAEVKNEFARELVINKKLSAFSWKGYSYHQAIANGVKELKAIDLVEISLVHTPDSATSTFTMVDKDDPSLNMEYHMKDCDIYKIQFKKENYSLDELESYTKSLCTKSHEISENEDSFFVHFGKPADLETDKSFSIQVGDRKLIAAPKIKKKIMEVSHVGNLSSTLISKEIVMDNQPETTKVETPVEAQKLFLLDLDVIQSQFPGAKITFQKNSTFEDVPVEIHTLEVDVPEVQAEVAETEVIEATETIEPKATEAVETDEVVNESEEKELSEVEKLTQMVANLTGLWAAKEEAEAKAKEDAEATSAAEKAAEELASKSKEEAVLELQKQLAEQKETAARQEESRLKIEKQFAAFGSVIPSQEARSEKVETQKSLETKPEANCMSYFGFVKEKN